METSKPINLSMRASIALIIFSLLLALAEGGCGNGIVEDGEECDCGPADTCKDPCCRALVCTLKEGADCSNLDSCCRNCKFKRKWELCRSSESECDLPEYCTGSLSSCPPNIFHRDGYNCSDNQGYCSKGYCHTHLDQCKIIFKNRPVSTASQDCYLELNGIGNERGHCGDLRACSAEDALCGTLQCIDIKGSPTTSFTLSTGELGGSSSMEHNGDCQPIGSTAPFVQDRTKCGDGKICQKQRCVNVSTVFSIRAKCPGYSKSDDVECSGNGYCTSRLTCLCHEGWTGRDCSEAELVDNSRDHVPTTYSTAIVHDIPVTRSEPQGVVIHKHAENEEDTNYTLGMIFAIAVVSVSITFFMCALIYCYLFSSPISKAKESLDSQGDDYSLDTNTGVNGAQTEVTKDKSSVPMQQLEVHVDIPASNGQVVNIAEDTEKPEQTDVKLDIDDKKELNDDPEDKEKETRETEPKNDDVTEMDKS